MVRALTTAKDAGFSVKSFKINEKGEIEGNYGGPGTPVSLTFLGQLFGEARLLALARAYQQETGFHTQHPTLTAVS